MSERNFEDSAVQNKRRGPSELSFFFPKLLLQPVKLCMTSPKWSVNKNAVCVKITASFKFPLRYPLGTLYLDTFTMSILIVSLSSMNALHLSHFCPLVWLTGKLAFTV